MVLSLFHKIIAPGFFSFFAALLGGGRSPLTHFSDYASLCPCFPMLSQLMLFLSSPVSISFASKLQSAFVTLRDGNAGVWCLYARRYYNIIVHVMKSSLAPQSSWRVQFSVIAGKLNMAVSLPFQWGPSHIERRGGRESRWKGVCVLKHTNQHTQTNNHPKLSLLIKVFHT